MKTLARPVIPESDLVPLDIQTIPIRVATRPSTVEIKATNPPKPWDTSLFSRNSGTSSIGGWAEVLAAKHSFSTCRLKSVIGVKK